MSSIEIRIPQLGEGLQEARIVRFLKQPGEAVAQDEPIYEMETDKAVMEIESPAAGVIESWDAKEDDIVPIGALIGRINPEGKPAAVAAPEPEVHAVPAEVAALDSRVRGNDGLVESSDGGNDGLVESSDGGNDGLVDSRPRGNDGLVESSDGGNDGLVESSDGVNDRLAESPNHPITQSPPQVLRNAFLPPRTRSYARQRGVSEEELARLVQQSQARLLPESIDAYLSQREALRRRQSLEKGDAAPTTPRSPAPPTPSSANGYQDLPLAQKQRTLVYRLTRGTQDVIPATMEVRIQWNHIEAARAAFKSMTGDAHRPSQFLLFAYCVAQASTNHPRFRSALLNETTLREHAHLHMGIAVARPDDELLLARIADADTLEFPRFVTAAQEAIQKAREGLDQTADVMQLSLTNMSGAGVRSGIPVLVAPAVATLFIGEPYDEAFPLPGGGIGFRRMANMVLTFDHRIANGIGAANFLTEIRRKVEHLAETLGEYLPS